MLTKLVVKKTCNIKDYKTISKEIFEGSIFHTELGLSYISNRTTQDTFFLYDNNKLVGYLRYGKSPEYFNEFGIKFLGILPKYRGDKNGLLLVQNLVKKYKSMINYMYLSVPVGSTFLKKYYSDFGFKIYKTVYATKFENDLFGWFNENTIIYLSQNNKILEKTPKLIMRYKLR